MVIEHLGNGIYQASYSTSDGEGFNFPETLSKFVGEHPELRITAVSAINFFDGDTGEVFVIVTEPRAQSSP